MMKRREVYILCEPTTWSIISWKSCREMKAHFVQWTMNEKVFSLKQNNKMLCYVFEFMLWSRALISLNTHISRWIQKKTLYYIWKNYWRMPQKKKKNNKMKKFHILTKLFMCTVYMTAPDKKNDKRGQAKKCHIFDVLMRYQPEPSWCMWKMRAGKVKNIFNFVWSGVGWEMEMHRNSRAFQINVTLTNDIIEHELDFDPWRSTQSATNMMPRWTWTRGMFFYREKCQPTKTFSFLPPLSGVPRRCSDAREQKQEFLELHNSRECMMMARWEGRTREWRGPEEQRGTK